LPNRKPIRLYAIAVMSDGWQMYLDVHEKIDSSVVGHRYEIAVTEGLTD